MGEERHPQSGKVKGTDSNGKQTAIQAVSPDVHFLANPPKGYKPDMNSAKTIDQILDKANAAGKKVMHFSVTVVAFYATKYKPPTG
jgi:hypothetical protein